MELLPTTGAVKPRRSARAPVFVPLGRKERRTIVAGLGSRVEVQTLTLWKDHASIQKWHSWEEKEEFT